MKILSIETSCDETALALIEANGGLKSPKFKVLKNIVSSQIKIHAPFGGVVPNLAKREHLKNLPLLFKNLKLEIRNSRPPNLLAVTVGPGLEPCLWTGVGFAKEIKKKYFPKAKLIGVNHLEGHLYSFLLTKKTVNSKIFPAVALIVSGGHTILLLMKSLTEWKKLGETRDDAVGEAFDKVARMLELPFPGGPEIEKLAKSGNSNAINFPRPMINSKDYDFSFSGLKTSVLYFLRDSYESTKTYQSTKTTTKNFRNFVKFRTFVSVADIAASFERAAVDTLVAKTMRAAKECKAKSVMLSGGVAANKLLRKELKIQSSLLKANFFAPSMKFNTDNAAMIGVAAYISYLKRGNRAIRAQANLNL